MLEKTIGENEDVNEVEDEEIRLGGGKPNYASRIQNEKWVRCTIFLWIWKFI